MPTVQRSKKQKIARVAWGCSCRSFRPGEPDPEAVYKRIVAKKSGVLDVNVKLLRKSGDVIYFDCWTGEDHYTVVRAEYEPTGWCKHVAACALFLEGNWLRVAWEEMKNQHWIKHEEGIKYRREIRKLENRLNREKK